MHGYEENSWRGEEVAVSGCSLKNTDWQTGGSWLTVVEERAHKGSQFLSLCNSSCFSGKKMFSLHLPHENMLGRGQMSGFLPPSPISTGDEVICKREAEIHPKSKNLKLFWKLKTNHLNIKILIFVFVKKITVKLINLPMILPLPTKFSFQQTPEIFSLEIFQLALPENIFASKQYKSACQKIFALSKWVLFTAWPIQKSQSPGR